MKIIRMRRTLTALSVAALAAGSLATPAAAHAKPASASAAWVVQFVPKGPGTDVAYMSLPSVSCVPGGTCLAVGGYSASDGQGKPTGLPYAVRKTSGHRWAVLAVPEPAGYATGGLSGVSCASASFCMAVGQYTSTANVSKALAEQWNGTAWTVRSVPSPADSSLAGLSAVSCPLPTACMAVGSVNTASSGWVALAEFWDGTSWAVVPTSNENAALSGVSCISASSCVAVGEISASKIGPDSLVETWNGSTWTASPVPQPSGVTESPLTGVSCSSASACAAVGYTVAEGTAAENGLAERWNGTRWSMQTVPAGSTLMGVSCPTARSCTAVGELDSEPPPPAAYSWSPASGWTAETAAAPSHASTSGLDGVSCQIAVCTATGFSDRSGNSPGGRPLAEHE